MKRKRAIIYVIFPCSTTEKNNKIPITKTLDHLNLNNYSLGGVRFSVKPWLSWNSLGRPGWPRTLRDLICLTLLGLKHGLPCLAVYVFSDRVSLCVRSKGNSVSWNSGSWRKASSPQELVKLVPSIKGAISLITGRRNIYGCLWCLSA